jgi:hypothetical protein
MLNRETLRTTSSLAVVSGVGLAFIAWSGTQLYVIVCAPAGFTGFLQSMMTMDSSPCQALFSVISHTQTLYGATIASLLFAFMGFLGSCIARASPDGIGPGTGKPRRYAE